MDFNDLFSEIGGYGRYQRLVLLFVLLPAQLPYLCQIYSHLFMSITPEHWCKVSLLDPWNVTDHFTRHLFVPKKDNILHSLQYEHCFAYNISYKTLIAHSTQVGWIPNQRWPITKCSEGWVYNRTLLGEDNSIITKWDLVCDRAFKETIPVILFFFGSFLGLIFGYIFSNKFGKKNTYFLMLSLQCLIGTVTAFTSRLDIFYALRFGMGFSIPNIALIPKSISLELISENKRVNVLLETELCHNFGALLLVLVSYFVRDFQHLTVAVSSPFVVFFFYFWLFPESPKWLIVNEKVEKVDKMVRDMASTNLRFYSPDYSISLRRRIRIECALQREHKPNQTSCLLLIKLLFLPNMRTKAITLCILYITHSITDIGFTYYVIHFSENGGNGGNGDIYFPFLVAIICNFLGILITKITLSRFGRKYTVIFGDILSAFFSVMSAFVKNKDINLCLIYFASAKVFQSSSLYCLIVWTHELIGVSHYYSVINLCESLSHLALTSVPLIIYFTNKKQLFITNGVSLSMCLSIFGLILLISAFFCLTLPDTNHEISKKCFKTEENTNYSNRNETQSQIGKPKNGILKNKGPQPQSPIISLLRRQEMIRQNESEFENNGRKTHFKDPMNEICTIKVTVL